MEGQETQGPALIPSHNLGEQHSWGEERPGSQEVLARLEMGALSEDKGRLPHPGPEARLRWRPAGGRAAFIYDEGPPLRGAWSFTGTTQPPRPVRSHGELAPLGTRCLKPTLKLPGFRNSAGLTVPSKAMVDSDKISCLGREWGSVPGI